jgi:hypothetical protein
VHRLYSGFWLVADRSNDVHAALCVPLLHGERSSPAPPHRRGRARTAQDKLRACNAALPPLQRLCPAPRRLGPFVHSSSGAQRGWHPPAVALKSDVWAALLRDVSIPARQGGHSELQQRAACREDAIARLAAPSDRVSSQSSAAPVTQDQPRHYSTAGAGSARKYDSAPANSGSPAAGLSGSAVPAVPPLEACQVAAESLQPPAAEASKPAAGSTAAAPGGAQLDGANAGSLAVNAAHKMAVSASLLIAAHRAPSSVCGEHAASWVEALAQGGPFAGMPRELLHSLLEQFQYAALPSGTRVLVENTIPAATVLFLSGECCITAASHGQQHSDLAAQASQSAGGEQALQDHSGRAPVAKGQTSHVVGAGWLVDGDAFVRGTASPVTAAASCESDAPLVALVLLRSDFAAALWRHGFNAVLADRALGPLFARLPPAQRESALTHVGLAHVAPGAALCLEGQPECLGVVLVHGSAVACAHDAADVMSGEAVGECTDSSSTDHYTSQPAAPRAYTSSALQQALAGSQQQYVATLQPGCFLGAEAATCGSSMHAVSAVMTGWGAVLVIDLVPLLGKLRAIGGDAMPSPPRFAASPQAHSAPAALPPSDVAAAEGCGTRVLLERAWHPEKLAP